MKDQNVDEKIHHRSVSIDYATTQFNQITRKQKLLVLDNSTCFKYPRTMLNYPLFPIVITLQNE